jgi:hypothetical protein
MLTTEFSNNVRNFLKAWESEGSKRLPRFYDPTNPREKTPTHELLKYTTTEAPSKG